MILHKIQKALTFFSPIVTDQILSYLKYNERYLIVIKDSSDKKLLAHLLYATGCFDEKDEIELLFKQQFDLLSYE